VTRTGWIILPQALANVGLLQRREDGYNGEQRRQSSGTRATKRTRIASLIQENICLASSFNHVQPRRMTEMRIPVFQALFFKTTKAIEIHLATVSDSDVVNSDSQNQIFTCFASCWLAGALFRKI
jgi:hypothetical protein